MCHMWPSAGNWAAVQGGERACINPILGWAGIKCVTWRKHRLFVYLKVYIYITGFPLAWYVMTVWWTSTYQPCVDAVGGTTYCCIDWTSINISRVIFGSIHTGSPRNYPKRGESPNSYVKWRASTRIGHPMLLFVKWAQFSLLLLTIQPHSSAQGMQDRHRGREHWKYFYPPN